MTRLLLLILLGFAVTYYFPESRVMLDEAARPLVNRVVIWVAQDEMASIGAAVVEHEVLTGELPDRRDWQGWLDWRYQSADAVQDPWGRTYQIRAWADSVAIISYGPDGERNTDDDFQVVTPRERRR